jgi:hypothetical protein
MLPMNINDIFFVLSDSDSLEMIRMVDEQLELDKAEFDSPKRYYRRIAKLRKALIIKKKRKSYELTAFGSILHEIVKYVEVTRDLHWKLQVIDSLDDMVPGAERKAIIESLIPDKTVRAILLAKYRDVNQLEKIDYGTESYKQENVGYLQLLGQK